MSYYLQEIAIDIEDLKSSDKSYKWLVNNSQRIKTPVRDIIDDFYKKYITSPEKMCRYVVNPEWSEASNNVRFRFVIIKVEDDYVLVPLKIISPVRQDRYFSLSTEPISSNNSIDSIKSVLQILSEFSCVRYISIPEIEKKNAKDSNYYNLPKDFSKMDRSTWRSKRGVNKLMKIIDFDGNAELIPGIENMISTVNGIWNDIKRDCGYSNHDLSKKIDENLAKLSLKNDSIYLYSFNYHDKLIGYSIATIIVDKYIMLLSTKQITGSYNRLSTYMGEDTDELKMVHKHLSSFMQYMIHKDAFLNKGFEGIYNSGDMGIKGLKDFKQDYYSNVLYYNRYPISDYLKRIN